VVGAQDAAFTGTVKPFLKKHCVRCHGPDREEADVRVDQVKWDLNDLHSIDELQNILDEIVVDSMPPANEPRPREDSLEAITKVLSKHIQKAREKHSSGGGRPVRRLTKTELVNTITDLLGVELNAEEMPTDGVAGNFDTLALDLYTTDAHLGKFQDLAREAVTKFIAGRSTSPPKKPTKKRRKKRGKKNAPAPLATNHKSIEFFKRTLARHGNQVPDSAARELLEDFSELMNRGRKVDPKLPKELFKIFQLGRKQGQPFWEALVEPMALSMSAIEVMFHFETRGEATDSRYVSPVEMVNRVSYLLWRSAPDAELLKLAKSKKWYEPAVRKQQFDRMIKDKKFERFLNDFTVQWLELDKQDEVAIDEQVYPNFNQDAQASMKEETIQFVSHVVRENMSLVNLIESDFMMVNDLLADHYGLSGVKGSHFRSVPVPKGSKRGGLLTQAGILIQTSTGQRTSIVERGAFVARKFLNDPPGTPPPLVDELPSDGEAVARMTAAELVLRHRKAPQCASCHKLIDSLGVGMEELDGAGNFRTVDVRLNPELSKLRKRMRRNPKNWTIELPLATDGKLYGRKFKGIDGLKKNLLKYDEKLAEAYIEALLTFANGRKAGVADQTLVQDILSRAKDHEFPARSILIAVLQSDAFRTHNSR